MKTNGTFQRPGKLILTILLLASWPLLSGNTLLQGKWTKLATRTITYTVDHSELVIDGLAVDLDAVRVRVKTGAINLHRCVVYYKNGQSADVDVLNSIPAGNESKVIELPAPVRTVAKLVFTYDTKNRAIQKADVEIWGRRN